ncbi:hypothetical protein PR048_033473 [Dryococelus australis]|uniref:Uncharacterized protein n=1 Tax=Dryococelus australis TaxID=614101 RepID=A0ABQ9G0D8_9NEOP|nr:hypothetical protein PR048_033473 [Dryococelus australis]
MQGDVHRCKEGLGSHGLHFGAMTTSLSVLRASLNYEERGKNRQERRKFPSAFVHFPKKKARLKDANRTTDCPPEATQATARHTSSGFDSSLVAPKFFALVQMLVTVKSVHDKVSTLENEPLKALPLLAYILTGAPSDIRPVKLVTMDGKLFHLLTPRDRACSPPTNANWVRYPAGSLPDFRMWGSCRATPLVGGISGLGGGGLPVSPALSLRAASYSPRFTLIGSQDLAANRVRFPAGPLSEFSAWESCRTIRLVSGVFSGISRFPPPTQFIPALLHTHIASLFPALKSRSNMFTHSPALELFDHTSSTFSASIENSGMSNVIKYMASAARLWNCTALPSALRANEELPWHWRGHGVPGSIPGWVTPGLSRVGTELVGGFSLGSLPFPPPFHSGAAPYSPHFTLIGSQDLVVKSRPNLFTSITLGGGNGRDLRENPPTSGIVRHDSHLRKSGVTRPGIEPGLPWGNTARSHQGEPGLIPGGVTPGFTHVRTAPDDTAGLRVFSGISRFTRPCISALLHTHLASPSSAIKTSILRAAQISLYSLYIFDYFPSKCRNANMDKWGGGGGKLCHSHSLYPSDPGSFRNESSVSNRKANRQDTHQNRKLTADSGLIRTSSLVLRAEFPRRSINSTGRVGLKSGIQSGLQISPR